MGVPPGGVPMLVTPVYSLSVPATALLWAPAWGAVPGAGPFVPAVSQLYRLTVTVERLAVAPEPLRSRSGTTRTRP